jgi:peroxiredoxin
MKTKDTVNERIDWFRRGRRSALGLLLVLACSSSLIGQVDPERRPPPAVMAKLSMGLDVGRKIPAFRAADQHGQMQDFDSIRGPKGALIVFLRSADWCVYCKAQLVELQQYREELRKQGVGLCTISYDTVAILADFGKRKGITFPMLADPRSLIVTAFGLLNDTIAKDDWHYGMANPGAYLVAPDGIVKSKYFARDFTERYATPTILLREFGSVSGAREAAVSTDYLDLKAYSTKDLARPNLHLTLLVDVDLKPNMHVYAPGVEHYIPISLELDHSSYYTARPVEYPRPETVTLTAINETVPVYQGKFRILQDVMLQGRDTLSSVKELKIKGRLRYQACDDKMCYSPQIVNLEWPLKLETLELVLERVPDEIQHGAGN